MHLGTSYISSSQHSVFPFSRQALNESFDFCKSSKPHEHQKYNGQLIKLTYSCNMLLTSHSFTSNDNVVMIEGEPTPVHTCRTSIGCSFWLFCFSILQSIKTVDMIKYYIYN